MLLRGYTICLLIATPVITPSHLHNVFLVPAGGYNPDEEWTALHWAVWYNQVRSVRILLSHGADFNLVRKYNESCCLEGTALQWAKQIPMFVATENDQIVAVIERFIGKSNMATCREKSRLSHSYLFQDYGR